jgi:hypothetical protein
MQQPALHAPAASENLELKGGPTTETDSNTSTNDEAAAAHADPDNISLGVREIMEDLIEAVNNKDAKDDPLPTIPSPLPPPGLRSASQRRIPLSELLVYPEAGAANPLAFYWKGGLWDMQRETAALIFASTCNLLLFISPLCMSP